MKFFSENLKHIYNWKDWRYSRHSKQEGPLFFQIKNYILYEQKKKKFYNSSRRQTTFYKNEINQMRAHKKRDE